MLKTPFPYQSAGAQFLASRFHALLADEPGLGKTVQAIMAAEMLGLRKILVVCPASVRLNWAHEIDECLGPVDAPRRRAVWHVISYNGATSPAVLAKLYSEYDAIILDEAHFVKTPSSLRTQAILGKTGLARRAQYKWALTGTPILNRPRELFPVLKTLHPGFADMAFTKFAHRYCGAFFDGYTLNTRGATNLGELAGKLEGFMLRRLKIDVMPDLPPKLISRVPLSVSSLDLERVRAEEALISDRPAKISSIAEDFSQLGDLSHLLRLTGEAKVHAAVTFIDELLNTVDKVVVFARHREVIRLLKEALETRSRKVTTYTGGMTDTEKESSILRFKMPQTQVFLGNIQAAGTGINGLQEVCSHVVFAELSWVPGETGQAIDRCHRLGQKASSVNVYLLHAPGTLESAVLGVHTAKTKIIGRLMGEEVAA